MKNCIKYILGISLLFISNFCLAQSAEMADTFRSEGKIYVVVAIILVILIGLILYLFLLDRKLNKLEELVKGKTKN